MTDKTMELAKVLYEARLDELARQQGFATNHPADKWEKAEDDERGQAIAQARAAIAHLGVDRGKVEEVAASLDHMATAERVSGYETQYYKHQAAKLRAALGVSE